MTRYKPLAFPVVILLLLASVYLDYAFFQQPIDWRDVYKPAALAMMAGGSPYTIGGFFNPPWILFLIAPLTSLSDKLGGALMFGINLALFSIVMWRMKVRWWLAIPLVLFSGILRNSQNGNIEGFVALGMILPAPVGLFLVLLKPQIGLPVAVFWLIEAWRRGGFRNAALTFAPVIVAFLASFAMYGLWILNGAPLTGIWWNTSIFPFGVPIGIVLLLVSVFRQDIGFAMAAGPFFAPYLTMHTWAFVPMGLCSVLGVAEQVIESEV